MIAWLRTATGVPAAALVLFAITLVAAVTFLVLAAAHREGRRAGEIEDLERTVTVQERMNDADAHGPRTSSDVDRRLRDGNF